MSFKQFALAVIANIIGGFLVIWIYNRWKGSK